MEKCFCAHCKYGDTWPQEDTRCNKLTKSSVGDTFAFPAHDNTFRELCSKKNSKNDCPDYVQGLPEIRFSDIMPVVWVLGIIGCIVYGIFFT